MFYWKIFLVDKYRYLNQLTTRILERNTNPKLTKYFRIIDFGLAKELGGPEKERCGMDGTLEFMAPEVIRWIHVLFSVR